MKQLIAGIVLILVIGVAAFFYRNMTERPEGGDAVACTMEAKLCPDGTSVGRQGPNCEFAACALPNVELAEDGITFLPPAGYERILTGAPGQETLVTYQKASQSETVQHTISIKRYPIPAGQTADDVILANTRYQPSDMPAADFARFETVAIGGREYRVTVIERFEALVQSSYFTVRGNEVLRFDVVEHDVTDWMEQGLDVSELPEHAALEGMLETIQIAG